MVDVFLAAICSRKRRVEMYTARGKNPDTCTKKPERELKLNRKACLKPRRKYWVIKRAQDVVLTLVALAVLR